MWCNSNFIKAKLRHIKALALLLHLYQAQEELSLLAKMQEASAFETEIKDLTSFIRSQIKEYSSVRSIAKFMNEQFDFTSGKAYIGPIEIIDTKERGRGYYSKKDIVRGEILLIEEGFTGLNDESTNPMFCYKLASELEERIEKKALYMNLFPNRKFPLPAAGKGNAEMFESLRSNKCLFELFIAKHPKAWVHFNLTQLYQLLLKTQLNSFKVGDRKGVFPNLCLFNHSCDPNVSVWFVKNSVMLLAQRDIPKGQEVFVSYVPHLCLKHERMEKLQSIFGFECDCPRCKESGEWKQKEIQLLGKRCPKCGAEIPIDADKLFICPRGCSQYTFMDYQI